MVDEKIAELASRQQGLFSRSQVFELGGTEALIRRRLAAGRWRWEAPGVYGLPGWPVNSWHRVLWLAHLDIGPSSVVSHEAAAALHGLATFRPGPVVLSVSHGAHHRHRPFKVRQSTDLRTEDICWTEGLPVTTPARTLFDLSAVCRRHRLERALDEAHVDRTCRIEEVAAVYHALRRPGKRGMRMLGRVLARRGSGFGPPESVLERRLLAVLRDGGLPEPCPQFRPPWRSASGERVDFAYPEARVIIEADGRRWHSRMDQMATDRARDREALNQGWRPYRFVWEDITERPDEVCATLRVALTGPSQPVPST